MPRLPILCMSGVLALTGTGAADGVRYPHTPMVPARVVLSERVRPHQVIPNAQRVRPALDADAVLSIAELLMPVRNEHEQILIALVANTPDSEFDEKSDYYFRLGTLYAQNHRIWRVKTVEYTAAGNHKEAAVAANKAKDYLLKAVKSFKGLVENDAFRNYPKMDVGLFYFGYTLQSGKYLKEARAVYDKLLKNYPNSKYVPEAHLAFGEYYFETGQLADAEARYKMVLKFPKSSAYWYAMYKMGEIHLELQRFQEALETFFQVVQATKTDPNQAALHGAAKQEFVRAYAEIGKADKAHVAFQRVDSKDAFDMLTTLANGYTAQGKTDKAIYVLREMMAAQPKHPSVCAWQHQIAHAMVGLTGATPDDVVKEVEGLVKLWRTLEAAAVLPPAEARTCHDDAAAMAGELGRAYHVEAATTKNATTMAYAERLYASYLDAFPTAVDRAQVQHFHAETLWSAAEAEPKARLRAERWERVADAFAAVTDPATKRAAALTSVLAWKNALELDPQPPTTDIALAIAASAPRPRPLPAREARLLVALDAAMPDVDADEGVRMKLVAATLLRRYDQFDKAVPILAEIVERHRQHESVELAANLLLEALIRLERYDAVLELADKLRADARFLEGKPILSRNISLVRSRSLRRH